MPLAWEYKDLKGLNKDNIIEYLEMIKDRFCPQEELTDFARLQREFESMDVAELEPYQDPHGELNEPPMRTKIEVAENFLSKQTKKFKPKKISSFFNEELQFVSENYKTLDTINEDDVAVDFPLPCDNYFIYSLFNSVPDEKIKHEFLFLINIFSVYMQEPLEDILKVRYFIKFWNIPNFDRL